MSSWRGNAHFTAFAKARWGRPSPLEREEYHVAEAWFMCQESTRDETEVVQLPLLKGQGCYRRNATKFALSSHLKLDPKESLSLRISMNTSKALSRIQGKEAEVIVIQNQTFHSEENNAAELSSVWVEQKALAMIIYQAEYLGLYDSREREI